MLANREKIELEEIKVERRMKEAKGGKERKTQGREMKKKKIIIIN